MNRNGRSQKKRTGGIAFGLIALGAFLFFQWFLYSLIKGFTGGSDSPDFMKSSPGLWAAGLTIITFLVTAILVGAIFLRMLTRTGVDRASTLPLTPGLATTLVSSIRRAERQQLTGALLGLVAVVFNKYLQEQNLLHSLAIIITSGGAVFLVISSMRSLMTLRAEARAAQITIDRSVFDSVVLIAFAAVVVAIGYLAVSP